MKPFSRKPYKLKPNFWVNVRMSQRLHPIARAIADYRRHRVQTRIVDHA